MRYLERTKTAFQIIVGMDANEDVRNGEMVSLFNTLHIREVILQQHKAEPAKPHITAICERLQQTEYGQLQDTYDIFWILRV